MEEMVTAPRNLILAVTFVILAAVFSTASDIYIAQNAAGGNTGADCADAHPASWFNTSSNWGSNAGLIGPGTTVHLCGTFTAPAGSSGYLTFQGSGASGNPVTLLFESGAVLTAPYWGNDPNGFSGAIHAAGLSYITVDGGTNGTIQATANGTGMTYQQAGSAVYFNNVSNSEVKNLVVSDIYQNIPPNDESSGGEATFGVNWVYGSNVTVDNNTIHDAKWCIDYNYTGNGTSSNITAHSNTIYNCDHGVVFGDGNSNAMLTGSNSIYSNVIHDGANWDDNNNNNHHDGVHLWAVHSGSRASNTQIYSNYIYGQWGQHLNSLIFAEGAQYALSVFNNVLASATSNGYCGAGILAVAGQGMGNSNPALYNNTLVNGSTQTCPLFGITATTGITIRNNIATTSESALYIPAGSTLGTISNNVYYNLGGGGWNYLSGAFSTLSAWQAACNCDFGSTTSNPNLGANYEPPANSPAVGQGANLTDLGITVLDSDKAGVLRASNGSCIPGIPGCWDAGAYQYKSGNAPPNPPTALSAQVQ